MRTMIETLGDYVMAVTWPLLFGMAILAIVLGRLIGFGEREDQAEYATES